MLIKSANELEVYKRAYALAMKIFETTSSFPKEEKYALTDQIRRASRSVCSNIQEAWAKRRYEAHFISKSTDADGECNETRTWLDFSRDCDYLDSDTHKELIKEAIRIGGMLGKMIKNPSPFLT